MIRSHDIDPLIADVPLFSRCSNKELAEISQLTTPVNVAAGKVVAHQGTRRRELIVIVEGTATVSIDGHEVATLGPGDFVGEISLLDGGPRSATVTANTDIVAEVAGAREFHTMLQDAPSLARSLLQGVAARLRATDVRFVH
jgi:CRP/FNR family cyclic AMP-dependent transcriptional regulator